MSLLKKTAAELTVADHLKMNGIAIAIVATVVTAPLIVGSAVKNVKRRFKKNDTAPIEA